MLRGNSIGKEDATEESRNHGCSDGIKGPEVGNHGETGSREENELETHLGHRDRKTGGAGKLQEGM